MNRQYILGPLLILLCCRVQNVYSFSIHDLQLPSNSTVTWVARNVQHNGVPIEIQKFSSSLEVEEILQFYRQHWDSLGDGDTPGYLENTLSEWSIISRSEWNKSLVIQLKPGVHQETEGFVSMLDPTVRPISYTGLTDIPLPHNSKMVSYTLSNDFDRSGKTTVFTTSGEVASVYRFYKSNMSGNGWTLSTSSDTEESSVLLFSKNDEYCEISISSIGQGETIMMINRVGRPD